MLMLRCHQSALEKAPLRRDTLVASLLSIHHVICVSHTEECAKEEGDLYLKATCPLHDRGVCRAGPLFLV